MLNWLERQTAAIVRAKGLRKNRVGHETHDESVARILSVATKRLRSRLCTLITTGPDGPTARVVMPFPPTSGLTVHVATSPTSTKFLQAAATGKVVLAYSGWRSAVTAYCHADTLDSPEDRRRWWRPFFFAYWPDGPGENSAVIRCRPYAFEVFAPDAGVGPAPLGLRAARIELDNDHWRLAIEGAPPC
ncbi:MAG: hypothetical protein FWD53_08005 [Phycisphaerales bacterium]|nr:hypothetical protein [Phycisphaerales bacterium]